MAEVMIPPWVRPESPETIRMIDDATVAFQPAFGRGMTQRGIFADPRWGLRRRYRGLRSDEKAAILTALNESRGQFNTIRVTPHMPIRGSFPATELITNGTFSSGTTGWTSSSEYTLSSGDRILRARRNAFTVNADFLRPSAAISGLTRYAPYVARYFVAQGNGLFPTGFRIDDNSDSVLGTATTGFGMKSQVFIPFNATTALTPYISDLESSGVSAGDYLTVPYASLTRTALVDVGANALLYSDQFDQSAWTKANATVTANAVMAPDGTTTGDALVETGAAGAHSFSQSASTTSAVQDLSFACAVRAGTRGFCALEIGTAGGSVSVYVNLSTGAISTAAASTGTVTNARAVVAALGNSWYYIAIVGRKTGSETSASATVYAANVTGSASYTGTLSATAIYAWRGTLRVSSLPTKLYQSTTPVPAAESISGSALPLKGLVASTNGLLEVGDWFELDGELKQVTSRLNSDAAGLGILQFRPSLSATPADNKPIIIYEPFGRFIYPGTREFENLFGIYGDCEMNLEEVYS